MNLSQIRDQVIEYANRRGLFAASPTTAQINNLLIDTAVNGAITEICTLIDFRKTETEQTITLEVDVESYTINDDYAKGRYMLVKDSTGIVVGKLGYKDPEMFDTLQTSTHGVNLIEFDLADDELGIYTIEGDNVRIKPKPSDASQTLLFKYNKFLPDLVIDGDRNWFTDKYPMFCIFGALSNLVMMLQVRADDTVINDVRNEKQRWVDIITARESISKNTSDVPLAVNFGRVRHG